MLHFTSFFITFKCSLLVNSSILECCFAMAIRDFDFTSISFIICSEATQLVGICRIVQLRVTSNNLYWHWLPWILITSVFSTIISTSFILPAGPHTHSSQWILVALSHSGTVHLHLVKRLGIGGSSSPIHAIMVCELIKVFDVSWCKDACYPRRYQLCLVKGSWVHLTAIIWGYSSNITEGVLRLPQRY